MIQITEGAKEKAEELINSFLPLVNDDTTAIQCAIECTNHLFKMYISNGYSIGKYKEYPSYWEQVIIVLKNKQ
jgi:hypothetical protein